MSSARLALRLSARDHIRGPQYAPVAMVQYGDYESPISGAAYPMVEEVLRRTAGTVRFAFRHFPLSSTPSHAERAAEAAEAAGAQGRFWEMHHLIYTNQQGLDDDSLVSHAHVLGLDIERFTGELAAGTHGPRVHEDFMSGQRSGVEGTPAFFLDGVRHVGAYDPESLYHAIQRARAPRYFI